MTDIRHADPELKKLVDELPLASLGILKAKRALTNKRTRRIAEPHIRAHNVKGKVYYCYVRGTDPEIYLGSADTIRQAVQEFRTKIATEKLEGSYRD